MERDSSGKTTLLLCLGGPHVKMMILESSTKRFIPPTPYFFLNTLASCRCQSIYEQSGWVKEVGSFGCSLVAPLCSPSFVFSWQGLPGNKGERGEKVGSKDFFPIWGYCASHYNSEAMFSEYLPVYVIRNASRSWKFRSTPSKSCTWPIFSGFCIIEFALLTELCIFYLLTCGYVAFRAKLWHHVLFYDVFG